MSTNCDWCEGAGCDECKPKAKKGGAKAKPAEDAEKCEWCEGAGCDECESKKKMKAKAAKGGAAKSPAKKSNCDWCEGKGCDECQGKKDTAKDEGGDDPCEWCEGAGCDECGQTGTKKKGGSKKAAVCDFCDGAGCEQCADQHGGNAGGELTLDVKIANTFYEAEDLKNEDPKKAIITYRKVLEFTKELPSIADEMHTTIFKSMEAVVVLLYKTKQPAEMKSEYKKLLDYIPQVTRNEGSNAIDDVLNAVGGGEFKMLEEMYQITLDVLKKQKDAGRFVFDVGMKQCKAYIDKTQFKKAEEVLERLHMSCRLPDGSDDQKDKCSELIDIYAMKVQLSSLTNSGFEMKDLYERTKDLIKGVVSAKSQGVLRECWGKMFGDDGQWAKAKAEFYQAFTCYQSSGLLNNAKDCLKYAVVANMLSPEEVKEKKDEKKGGKEADKQKMTSVLDTKEAKQFETQKDVQAIATLQKAYEKSDVASFMTAATEIGRTADDFIRKHLQSMIREFQGKAIVQLVRAYRRIRLEHIGYTLKITNEEVENLLIQLILDGDISGVIDQVKGVLDLTQRTGGGGKKYQSLDTFTNAVWRLEEHMEMPITQF